MVLFAILRENTMAKIGLKSELCSSDSFFAVGSVHQMRVILQPFQQNSMPLFAALVQSKILTTES